MLKETVGIEKDKIVLYTKKDTQWSVLDVSFTPDQLFFNGYKKTKKAEVKNITSTLDLSVFSVMPTSFSSFKLIHFGTLDQLPLDSGYLVSKSDECGCDASYLGLGWVESPFTFLKNDLGGATYFISKINNLSDYRHAINNVVSDSLFNELDDESKVRKITNGFDYSSLFYEKTKFTAVVRINDFAIFSNSKENLERLLFQLYSNLTIDKNEKLVEFLKNNINKKSEFIEVSNGMKFMDFSLEEGISIFQSNSKKENLGYTSMLYSKEIKIDGTQTNPKWTLNLGAILNEKIYVVNNHRTNDKDYLIQDKNNIVSFVTPNGEIKWKKNIGNPIVGDIKNIDVLGNNKYQMIFNTKNQLFLIDILGRDVSDFPVKILDSATTNVSVMDYDKSQNFRFLVPTTKGIKSIDKSGNIVKGWKQPMASRTVRGDITHLLVSSKDYIVAADTSNSLYFYNRKGEERHTVSATFGYPIHFKKGSNISNSRAIFLDKKSNSISRQFFSKKDPSYLLTP